MGTRRAIILAAFLVFLAGYTIQKYLAAAPPSFDPGYLRIVLIIVAITALPPIAIMWPVGGAIKPFPAFAIVTVIGSVAIAATGFVAFWYFWLLQFPSPPPVEELARRGVAPGLFIAAILILNRWLANRSAGGQSHGRGTH